MEADEALARRLMREEAQEAERRKKRMEEEDERLARSLAKNEATSSSNAPKKEETEESEEKEGTTQTEKQRQSFVYEEKKGDLFVETEACLGHCVSEDLVMGKGIAKPFKDKFGGLSELRAQHPTTGGVCVLRRGGRFIYYLITKKVYRDKPTYAALQSSLEAMREHCTRHGVKQLALPRLGCGLDGLRWPNVSRILQDVFKDCPIHVRVYSL
ncbi:Macro domain [Balamuthia mandrillaris]